MMTSMPTVGSLDELTELAAQRPGLFVRWSRGPEADTGGTSADDLTGSELPGLSANPLAVEPWWEDRPLRLWIARRLHDYSHLERDKGPGIRPWVLEGEELGRGPDNEPLVHCVRPVAWIADDIIAEADRVVREQNAGWGSLRRPGSPTGRSLFRTLQGRPPAQHRPGRHGGACGR
jgi:hypothetical protein